MKTIISCLLDFILLFGIPYALLTSPQTGGIVSQTGIFDANSLSQLLTLTLIIISLTVVRNFTRTGSLINLIASLALIGVGISFFFLIGSYNASGPRLGVTSFFLDVNSTRVFVTLLYTSLAMIWLGVAGIKAVSVVLGFIEARRSKLPLKLPPIQTPVADPEPVVVRSKAISRLNSRFFSS